MNWTDHVIVKVSDIKPGDRMKTQSRTGNFVNRGQYLQVVSVVENGFHPNDPSVTMFVITCRNMVTKSKKVYSLAAETELGIYR